MCNYRVTYEGYIEGEYNSAEAAKQAFIKQIVDNELDSYGREWTALIGIEEFDEKTKTWI